MPLLDLRSLLELTGYRGVILTDSPLSYWRWGELAGTLGVDERGNNPATYTNSPTLGVAGLIAGDADTAVTLTASSSFMLAKAGAIVAGLSNLTIETWYKGTDTTDVALYAERAASGNDILKLELGGGSFGGKAHAYYRDDAGTLNSITGPTQVINDGVKHHVVFTMAGTTMTVSVDGVDGTPVTRTATLNFTDAGLESRWGSDKGDASAFAKGTFDESALYPLALTQAQRIAHFNAGNTAVGAAFAGSYVGVAAWAGTTLVEPEDLAGSYAGVSSWTGDKLVEPIDLAGSYAGVSSWSGDKLVEPQALTGSYTGVSLWSATQLTEPQALTGSYAGVSLWSGDKLVEPQVLVGASTGVSLWSGDRLVEPQALTGAEAGVSLWSGDLTPGSTGAVLAGAYAGVALWTGTLSAPAALAATYTAVSRWSGTLPTGHKKGDWPTLMRLLAEEHYRTNGRPKPPPEGRRQPQKERILARSLHRDLIDRYGPVEGRQVYRKMQAEQKGPFKPGAKYGPKVKR